jgi:2-polyprenyl-6-methoxyphenol hydroxylase-like FAD-dependent oxidoreductase
MSKIVIIGGSLGGLLVANLLHRQGHEVDILEKVQGSLDGRGAGIVPHPVLLHALELCGIDLKQNLGVPVKSRVTLGPDGQTIAKIDLEQTLTSWGHLYHLLKEVFPKSHYHSGKTVVSFGENSQEVLVHCDDGSSYSAELVIASDGLRSSVRNILSPTVKPEYAGYVAWRGVCDEFALSKLTRETLFPYFSFGLPEGEQILGYPVAGNDNDLSIGNRRYNFVWYRKAPEDTILKDLLTDADGNYHPNGISPVQVNWRHIAAIREAARDHLAPQFAEVIEKTALVFFQPIYDVFSEKIAFQRVALMGDAGFVARPHVGMGVSKAAEDALAIVQSISEHGATPEALLEYEEKRLVLGQRVIQRAQYLGQYMTAQGQAELKNNLEDIAVRVMKETAVDITDLLVNNTFIPNPQ